MAKIVKVTFNVAVDDSVSTEQVGQEFAQILEKEQDKATGIGSITVDTVLGGDNDVELFSSREPGWTNEIWKKATC